MESTEKGKNSWCRMRGSGKGGRGSDQKLKLSRAEIFRFPAEEPPCPNPEEAFDSPKKGEERFPIGVEGFVMFNTFRAEMDNLKL